MKAEVRVFRWHRLPSTPTVLSACALGNFASYVMDVSNGTQAALELLHADALRREDGTAPDGVSSLLEPNVADRLLRLCIAANGMLAEHAEEHLESLRNGCASARPGAESSLPPAATTP